ncbi:MAG: UDP-N-acetylglucosamine--N-acetylmuramyl-(pentapeptide) pyrophosphoryl-undecaprenol N-acetylglucosamine transferase, partial [Polyangiaceae bacterium]|nr:UDP-N-acetylglucosamine--N-acetylmuramyl-(pentapeptide) pyrophosphoryl-undecaprenol N-acetylglucosamine transferase [Polyangiaceae bacterium]
MGLPVALMEPNSVIGLANLLMAPFISRAYTAFALSEKHFSQEFIRRYGVPLRPGFEPKPYARSEEKLKILVLGGSQGAKALNEVLPKTFSELKTSLSIVHQCGHAHLEAVRARYKKSGYQSAEIVPFIEDMPRALENADLVVGRAGAGAVSEILAVGRPSLLIPYPFASGDHQRLNAQTL